MTKINEDNPAVLYLAPSETSKLLRYAELKAGDRTERKANDEAIHILEGLIQRLRNGSYISEGVDIWPSVPEMEYDRATFKFVFREIEEYDQDQ